MNIGVVGSRTFQDEVFLDTVLDNLLLFLGAFHVVTGGAEGADLLAIKWANKRDVPIPIVYPADWHDLDQPDALLKQDRQGQPYDARAGFRRNQQIVDNCTMVIAFMDVYKPTAGTSDTLNRAKKKHLPIYLYWPTNPMCYYNYQNGHFV